MFGIALKGPYHPFGGLDDTERMLKSRMDSPRVHIVCHAQLSDASKSLQQGTVEDQVFPMVEFNDSPDRIVYGFWEFMSESGPTETLKNRSAPSRHKS